MKILGLVPARSGSVSVPNKNIKTFAGHPLLAYPIAASKASKYIDKTIVSTDSKLYQEIARKYGAETPFLRPAEISTNTSIDFEYCHHAFAFMKEKHRYEADFIVILRATEPLRPKGFVDAGIEKILSTPDADSLRSITDCNENPYKDSWVRKGGRFMKPLLETGRIDRSVENYNIRRQALPNVFCQTMHIDIIRASILESGTISGTNILPHFIDRKYAADIDTPEDWEYAEYQYHKVSNEIEMPEIIS